MKNRALKILTFLILLAGCGACMLPLASKNFLRMDLNTKGDRVEIEEEGNRLLLSLFPLGESLDTKDVLLDLMEDRGCTDLKNVDIQYWNHSYFIISFDRIRVLADCVR